MLVSKHAQKSTQASDALGHYFCADKPIEPWIWQAGQNLAVGVCGMLLASPGLEAKLIENSTELSALALMGHGGRQAGRPPPWHALSGTSRVSW